MKKKEGIELSESTIGKILRRNKLSRKRKERKVFYPAVWVYDSESPFCLGQVDTKDIYDKGTLGKEISTPLILVMSWIRNWGIEGKTYWQEDWGQEFDFVLSHP